MGNEKIVVRCGINDELIITLLRQIETACWRAVAELEENNGLLKQLLAGGGQGRVSGAAQASIDDLQKKESKS